MAVMALDLTGYFERIDYRGPRIRPWTTLQNLVTAHSQAIPFENLDPLLGRPIDDLSPEALADKLIHRRRGGYCYEQNGLMGYVLEELGFGVRRFAGRVVWTLAPGDPMPAQTHTLLEVTLPGDPQPYLVDVGFGGQTPTSPIRLETGSVQHTTHEPYRLRTRDDVLVLQALIRGEWQSLYEFATRTAPPIDLKVGSWYVSTHPSSHFVTSLMVSLITVEGDTTWPAATSPSTATTPPRRPGSTTRPQWSTLYPTASASTWPTPDHARHSKPASTRC